MRFSMPLPGKKEALEELCRLALQERCEPAGALSPFPCPAAGFLYKWLERYRREGLPGLSDRSRRPRRSPRRTEPELEAAVLEVRRENPVWGGRKISATLVRQGVKPPSPSTITAILRRNEVPLVAPGQKAWKRFEHAEPNVLWQMDFKGEVAMRRGQLHPLTIVDDHSRYSVGLQAADNQRHETVQDALQAAFERYGLPLLMLDRQRQPVGRHRGKGADQARRMVDRAWRGAIAQRAVSSAEPWQERALQPHAQGRAAQWPHLRRSPRCPACLRCLAAPLQSSSPARRLEPRGLPADRFRSSPRSFSAKVEPFEYGPDDIVRRVDGAAWLSFGGRRMKASKALIGKQVAIRPTERDGTFDLVFRHVTVKSIDFHKQA